MSEFAATVPDGARLTHPTASGLPLILDPRAALCFVDLHAVEAGCCSGLADVELPSIFERTPPFLLLLAVGDSCIIEEGDSERILTVFVSRDPLLG